jgi:hypothetical protein
MHVVPRFVIRSLLSSKVLNIYYMLLVIFLAIMSACICCYNFIMFYCFISCAVDHYAYLYIFLSLHNVIQIVLCVSLMNISVLSASCFVPVIFESYKKSSFGLDLYFPCYKCYYKECLYLCMMLDAYCFPCLLILTSLMHQSQLRYCISTVKFTALQSQLTISI